MGVSSIECESSFALRVRDLAIGCSIVPERLVPCAGLIGFERSSSSEENALSLCVELVVELAVFSMTVS